MTFSLTTTKTGITGYLAILVYFTISQLLVLVYHQWPNSMLMWAVLDRRTCLNFGVVGPLRHLLLADEVINNPHADWWLSVVPLHDDQ